MSRRTALPALLLGLLAGIPLGTTLPDGGPWSGSSDPGSYSRPVPEARTARGTPAPPGRWRALPPTGAAVDSGELAMLLAVPYLSGTQPAEARTGVLVHHEERSSRGWNLYTSGHAPAAFLVDMEGKELHRWHATHATAWPELSASDESEKWHYWRRVHLLEDGGLLAIFEGVGLIRLDAESRLLWAHRGGEHHDLSVDEHGRIHVLGRRAKIDDEVLDGAPILEDFVYVLAPDGTLEHEISILEALRRSAHAPLLRHLPGHADLFHTNTLERFDGTHAERSSLFRAGNLLLSLRELDAIAILDPGREEIVWSAMGRWRRQHQPTLLANGNLLLFDNHFGPESSRVLEFDPFEQTIAWSHAGTETSPFFSDTCGSAQRLSNGNTLITESDRGRAFELDASGRIVWEFANPHRAGTDGELVATLFEVVRLEKLPAELHERASSR